MSGIPLPMYTDKFKKHVHKLIANGRLQEQSKDSQTYHYEHTFNFLPR